MARPASILILSNGHGEDAVGARLARALHELDPSLELTAFPTVGRGEAYAGGPARRVGPLRGMPSGGTMFRAARSVVADLRAGFVGLTLEQARALRALRADAVLAVGDVWAQTLALLPRAGARHAVQTLVSARTVPGSGYGVRAFRERFTLPERVLLRAAYRRVFVRDAASEAWLRAQAVPRAVFLGNPMMDGLDAEPLPLPGPGPRLAALPGSRDEAPAALAVLAGALARLPRATAAVAWARAEEPELPGWEPVASPVAARAWRRGGVELHLVRGAFAATLAWAELAVGTAGTAHEQAAGRGLPVVTFPHGAMHPAHFVANQRQLLGDALEAVPAEPEAIASALARLAADPAERARRGAVGRERMGPAGGSRRIAEAVLAG